MTVRPFECVLNSTYTLLGQGKLLPSKRRFRSPFKLEDHIRDVILWKFGADKGGGLWKLIGNPVNVENPQSVRHVQPICEFTANNSRENMSAGFFYKGSPCKSDIEDIIHRRCILLHVRVESQTEVAIVKNTSLRHHRHKPQALTQDYGCRQYTPVAHESGDQRPFLDERELQVLILVPSPVSC